MYIELNETQVVARHSSNTAPMFGKNNIVIEVPIEQEEDIKAITDFSQAYYIDNKLEIKQPAPPSLDSLKQTKIKELQNKYQSEYDAYLAQYPKREVESFDDKKKEALAYNADNSASTPLVDAMVGGDTDLRVEMLNAILAKVLHIAAQEGVMVATRDAIKACTTQDELDAIEV